MAVIDHRLEQDGPPGRCRLNGGLDSRNDVGGFGNPARLHIEPFSHLRIIAANRKRAIFGGGFIQHMGARRSFSELELGPYWAGADF